MLVVKFYWKTFTKNIQDYLFPNSCKQKYDFKLFLKR